MKHKSVLVVGAGLSGAVIARILAIRGVHVCVVEARNHVAGNCHTVRDQHTGVMVHAYGPHIFHTDDAEVWRFVNRFANFKRFKNQVKARVGGGVYALPINLHTINQFFGKTFDPNEARRFIKAQTMPLAAPARNFEEQALHTMGRDLYQAFFKGYTEKQWGREACDLPASLLKRLPLRFDYNDDYFSHRYQGIPEAGYSDMVARMLDHPLIEVHLGARFDRADGRGFDHVFYSGAVDSYFGHSCGRLAYRTLDFETRSYEGDFQGCAVMNYPSADVAYTRITEHKYFAPWESHERTICYTEFSRDCGIGDIPFYPIRLAHEKQMLAKYCDLAAAEAGVSFVGRLGTYRYLDMDVTIKEAMQIARSYAKKTGIAALPDALEAAA